MTIARLCVVALPRAAQLQVPLQAAGRPALQSGRQQVRPDRVQGQGDRPDRQRENKRIAGGGIFPALAAGTRRGGADPGRRLQSAQGERGVRDHRWRLLL